MPAPSVFISSTYRDNVERRKVAIDAVLAAGMHPLGMEFITADAQRPPLEMCLELARRADVVVAILAWRYGWTPEPGGQSITELECRAALEAGRPVLWFVIDDAAACVPSSDFDLAPEFLEKWPKLEKFKSFALEGAWYCGRFTDDLDLTRRVMQALHGWQRELRNGGAQHQAAAPGPWRPRGPYPGLVTFEEADEPFYFGREGEVEDALRRIGSRALGQNAWLSIEGASGAGKSSLVRAGLIPRARREAEPWTVALMRPGRDPVRELARAFAAAFEPALAAAEIEKRLREEKEPVLPGLVWEHFRSGGRLLLVIDQLEELFTHSLPDANGREPELERFTALLAGALAEPALPFQLVTTIRRDLLGELVRAPLLDDCRNRAQILNLPPMREPALLRTIAEPAKKADLRFDPPHLPERIARDAVDAGNALPLLAYCLRELAQDPEGVLHKKRYEELGGVKKALLGAADALLDRLRARSVEIVAGIATWEDAALRLLRALVAEAGTGFARRRLSRDEAIDQAGGGALGGDVYLALSGGQPASWEGEWPPAPRLVIDSGDQQPVTAPGELLVELAHESLLTDWRPFRDFLARERSDIEWRGRLEKAARSWHEEGEPADTGASGWTAERYEEIAALCSGPDVPRFLKALRRRRRLGRLIKVVLVVVGLLGIFHWWRGIELESFDAKLHYRLEMLRAWRDPLVPRVVDGRLVPGDPLAFKLLSHALSERELDRVRARRAVLEALERRSPREVFALETIRALEAESERLRASLVGLGLLLSPLFPQGRANLGHLWSLVNSTDGYHDILPRYDFFPLRYPGVDDGEPRSWQFLVLGTGHPPEWDASAARWAFTGDTGIVAAYLPGGQFLMGSPPGLGDDDERTPSGTQRRVSVSGFYLAVTEWTLGHEARLSMGRGHRDKRDASALPLNLVDWFDATARAKEAGGRLPTEAQWEFACRAASNTAWFHGDEEAGLEDYAWYVVNSRDEVQAVATREPSASGLHDMLGNLWEWCADWFGEYPEGESTDPLGPTSGGRRVLRGGAYWLDAAGCRSAFRSGGDPALKFAGVGFRVAFPATLQLDSRAVEY